MNARVTIRRIDIAERWIIDAMAAGYFAQLLPDGPVFAPAAIDRYWQDAGRYPYLIEVEQNSAGFALVWTHSNGVHELAEFTIIPAFRRCGIGTEAALMIFEALGGDWVLGVARESPGGLMFWEQCLTDAGCIFEVTRGPARTEHQIGSLSFRVAR